MNLWTRMWRREPEISRFNLGDYVRQLTSGGWGGLVQPLYPSAVQYSRGLPAERIENSFTGYTFGGYKVNPVIYGCMQRRSSVFSEARLMWRRLEDGKPGDLFWDEGLRLLEKPWPNGTTGELLAHMIQDVDLAGNCYIVNEGDRLRRLRPDWVSIVLSGNPLTDPAVDVVGYWYSPGGPDNGEGVPYLPDQVCHWCVDEETEILTAEGWKNYHDLSVNDEVLTLNHETGLSEWQPVLEVCVFPAQRRGMVLMEGQQFSSFSTENHRWPVERRNSKAGGYVRRWATSGTLSTGDRIPLAALSADTPTEAKWSDALVEIVAWFWTEGRFNSGRSGKHGRGIQIAQSFKNAENLDRIRAALTALFGAPVERIPKTGPRATAPACWRERAEDDMALFAMSANAGDVITQHAPGKVVTTAFLRSLTQAQLELFIRVSMLADNNGRDRLAQKSPAMAEQFALACILAGRPVSIRPGSRKLRGYRMTNVRMLRKRHVYPQPDTRVTSGAGLKVERVEYDGPVWCPRTPNQTWLARRNGSVYFTGNSPNPDPTGVYRGQSWLTPVVKEILAYQAATDHKLAFFRNGATLGPIVRVSDKMTLPQFKEFVDAAEAAHRGVETAYKTMYLGGGADVTLAAADFRQMEFTGSLGKSETTICVAAGVPAVIAGVSEGLQGSSLNGGNYAAAKRSFVDGTMRTLWRSAFASLSTIVEVPDDAELWFDEPGIAYLREDQQDQAQIDQTFMSAINVGITAGFEPDSVVAVLRPAWKALKHTGLTSVQLTPPGQGTLPPDGTSDFGQPTDGGLPPVPPGFEPDATRALLELATELVRYRQSDNTGTGGSGQSGTPQDQAKHPHAPSGPGGGRFTSTNHQKSPSGHSTPSKPNAPSTPQPPANPRMLKQGQSGEDVRYAQYAMGLLGFNVPQDGNFNGQTADAVKQMQDRLGQKPNGRINVSLLRKMQDAVRLSPCVSRSDKATAEELFDEIIRSFEPEIDEIDDEFDDFDPEDEEFDEEVERGHPHPGQKYRHGWIPVDGDIVEAVDKAAPLTGQAALDAVPTEYRSGPRAHFGDYEGATFTGPPGHGSEKALAEYEGVEYERTNSYLRHGPMADSPRMVGHVTDLVRESDAEVAARIAEIDKTMAVSRTTAPVKVSRVIKDGQHVFGDAWHAGVIDPNEKDFDVQDQQYERWLAGDRPDLTGVTWREDAYVSTSANPDHSEAFGARWAQMAQESPNSRGEPVIMTITVPAGTGAVQLGNMGFTEGPGGRQIMGSAEMLLQRGLTLKVTKDHGVDDKGFRQLDVEVTGGS